MVVFCIAIWCSSTIFNLFIAYFNNFKPSYCYTLLICLIQLVRPCYHSCSCYWLDAIRSSSQRFQCSEGQMHHITGFYQNWMVITIYCWCIRGYFYNEMRYINLRFTYLLIIIRYNYALRVLISRKAVYDEISAYTFSVSVYIMTYCA